VKISIVIPAFNAESTLAECLSACLAQSYPDVEVIVVDDGSVDGSAEVAQGFDVTYVHQENAGPAAARNRGVGVASGEIVALTDSDCIAEPTWIEELVKGFDGDDVVAVGGTYGIANSSSPLACMIHEEMMIRHEQFGDTVDFLGSFNVAYRRDNYLEVGGFDESFSAASGEDNDLAYRLHDAGGVMRFVPGAVVNHYHPTKLLPYLLTQMGHGFWRMKLYVKHPGRSGGDNYAGKLDFLAIPLSLIYFFGTLLIPFQLIFDLHSSIFLASLVAYCSCVLLYMKIRWNLCFVLRKRVTPDESIFRLRWKGDSIFDVLLLRDFFRGLGLVRGVWWFMILRRESA
jgi:glycosyltransferase involved in cell wall biosynthesis